MFILDTCFHSVDHFTAKSLPTPNLRIEESIFNSFELTSCPFQQPLYEREDFTFSLCWSFAPAKNENMRINASHFIIQLPQIHQLDNGKI